MPERVGVRCVEDFPQLVVCAAVAFPGDSDFIGPGFEVRRLAIRLNGSNRTPKMLGEFPVARVEAKRPTRRILSVFTS